MIERLFIPARKCGKKLFTRIARLIQFAPRVVCHARTQQISPENDDNDGKKREEAILRRSASVHLFAV
jgi:hypothetical protein